MAAQSDLDYELWARKMNADMPPMDKEDTERIAETYGQELLSEPPELPESA
jgi:hypothetical protein